MKIARIKFFFLFTFLILIPLNETLILSSSFVNEEIGNGGYKLELGFHKPNRSRVIREAYQTEERSIGMDLHLNSSMEHTEAVTSVSFSPNGTLLASGSYDNSIKLWNVRNGKILKTLSDHDTTINSVNFSPDGFELASVCDIDVRLWDAMRGKSKKNITEAWNTDISFSPDGNLLVIGGQHISLWNITSSDNEVTSESFIYTEGYQWIASVAFSPDGKLLASAHGFRYGPYIKLWNVTTKTELYRLSGHNLSVNSVAFSPDGKYLASGGGDSTIKLWNLSNGYYNYWKTILAHQDSVQTIAFSPDGKKLASGGFDSTIKLWDVMTSHIISNLTGHTQGVNSISYSPCGTILASGSDDNTVKLWNLVRGAEVLTLSGSNSEMKSIAFSKDGTKISGSFDTTINFWNVTNNYELAFTLEYSNIVNCVTFSPSGGMLASGSVDSNITLWNVNNGNIIRNMSGHVGGINSVAFSPDGTRLASGSSDKTISIWNVTSGGLIHTLNGHTKSVFSIAFSPDGAILASGSLNEAIKLWDVTTGLEIPTQFEYVNRVNSVTFSPDGTILASGSSDETITLWNITNGNPIRTISEHAGTVLSVAISPDGKLIASGSTDNTLRLWDITNGKMLQSFPEASNVFSVEFSPDNSVLASGSASKIHLWTIEPLPLDIDGDGMLDSWERAQGFNQSNFWDKFDDPDKDSLINSLEYFYGVDPTNNDSDADNMSDGWEYLMGLNLFSDDAFDDPDGDGIPNYYEFQHGLNARRNDGAEDKDGDKMPNLWEFSHEFKASDPTDAKKDPDGDWVINVEEYRGSSDPNNFWSVPIISFSALHFIFIFLISLLIFISSVIISYRRKKALISRLEAPDYKIALLIKRSGYSNHSSYLQAESNVKELVKISNNLYFQGDIRKSIEYYEQALTVFERLQNDAGVAEVTFKLCRILKDLGDLSPDSDILQHLPRVSDKNLLIQSFHNMTNALVAEAQKDWLSAKKEWELALTYEALDITYFIVCTGALVEVDIKQWLNNPIGPIPENLVTVIDNWQQACENSHYYESLCSLLLLRARIALVSYQFDEVTKCLDHCQQVVKQSNFTIYLNIIQNERKRFHQYKQRISTLLEAEKILSPEERTQQIQDYLKEAFLVKEELEE